VILWPSSISEETLPYLLQHRSDAVRGSGPVRCESNTGEPCHRAHYSNRVDLPDATAMPAPTAACESSCLPEDSWGLWVRGAASPPHSQDPCHFYWITENCMSAVVRLDGEDG